MTEFAVFDVSARFGYLKPPHVANGFLSACQSIRYCVLKSGRRGANDLNFFVNISDMHPLFPESVGKNNKKASLT